MNKPTILIIFAIFIFNIVLSVDAATFTKGESTNSLIEDFENSGDPPDAPDSPFYDYSIAGTGVFKLTSLSAISGSISYYHDPDGATKGSRSQFNFATVGDLCGGGYVDLTFNMPTIGQGMAITFRNGPAAPVATSAPAPPPGIGIYIYGGNLYGYALGDGQTVESAQILKAYTAGNSQSVRIKNVNCLAAAATIQIPSEEISVNVDGPGSLSGAYFMQLGPVLFNAFDSTEVMIIDDLNLINWADTPITLPPDDVVSELDVTGYAVDVLGQNILLRTNFGSDVVAYNAVSLEGVGTFNTPNCARADGVTAISTHVSFVGCDGAGNLDTIYIKSPSLGPPSKPSGCGVQCDDDVTDETFFPDFIEIPDEMQQLNILGNTGVYFYLDKDGVETAGVSFVFSDFNGNIGVWAAAYNNNAPDYSDIDLDLLDTTASPQVNDICFWRTPDNKDVVGAVTVNGATKFYESTVNFVLPFGAAARNPEVEIFNIFTNAATYAKGIGIDCAVDKAVIATDDGNIFIMSPLPGENQGGLFVNPISYTTTGDSRPVTISADGKYVAYRDDDTIRFVEVATGNISTTTVSVPSGNWLGMELDAAAQRLFIFTSTGITSVDVFPATTITPATADNIDQFGQVIIEDTGGGGGGTSTDEATSIDGGLFNVCKYTSKSCSVVESMYGFGFAIIIGIAVAIVSRHPAGFMGGATVGMFASVFAFGTEVIFTVVLLIATLAYTFVVRPYLNSGSD